MNNDSANPSRMNPRYPTSLRKEVSYTWYVSLAPPPQYQSLWTLIAERVPSCESFRNISDITTPIPSSLLHTPAFFLMRQHESSRANQARSHLRHRCWTCPCLPCHHPQVGAAPRKASRSHQCSARHQRRHRDSLLHAASCTALHPCSSLWSVGCPPSGRGGSWGTHVP